MVRGLNPVRARFFAPPERHWGPPSLLYNGYRVFPEGKVRPGRDADRSPLLVSRSWKSRAIPLSTLWATTGPVTGTLYFCLYSVICYGTFCLRVVSSFLCSTVFCPKLGFCVILAQSLCLFSYLSKCIEGSESSKWLVTNIMEKRVSWREFVA
jgi:hypothetical protein